MPDNHQRPSITFYDHDAKKNCRADMVLPDLGISIRGMKVSPGENGDVRVEMPEWMGSEWKCAEPEWEEVKRQVAEEYRTTEMLPPIMVELHGWDRNESCLADITLCESGIKIEGFKVKPGLGDGILVHMPGWMKTRWSYPEVEWAEVRRIVTQKYRAEIARVPDRSDTHQQKYCTFYSFRERCEATADIEIRATNERVKKIHLYHPVNHAQALKITFPPRTSNGRMITQSDREEWKPLIRNAYRRKVLGEDASPVSESVEITFYHIIRTKSGKMDLKLPHMSVSAKNFGIKKVNGESNVIVTLPDRMGKWTDPRISWFDLCDLITAEFNQYQRESKPSGSFMPAEDALPDETEATVLDADIRKQTRVRNDFGRVENAEHSAFAFYPRDVLRQADSIGEKKEKETKKSLPDLAEAMSSGSAGGIEVTGISILTWVAKLRFLNSTMLLDLIRCGYISVSSDQSMSQKQLTELLRHMESYNLIVLSMFVGMSEDGKSEISHQNMRIVTLGRAGHSLLKELKRNPPRIHAFDAFLDGNTVKRYLSANQWLIFWLRMYSGEIGVDYETDCLVHQKGGESSGAKFRAMVTINEVTMVAEPIRRVEKFEEEAVKEGMLEKLKRMIQLFDHLDELYQGTVQITFGERPIIVFVCEDDEHIEEIRRIIRPELPGDGRQEIWFTQDIRLYNYDKKGERFLCYDEGEFRAVDLAQYFGKDNEAEEAEE